MPCGGSRANQVCRACSIPQWMEGQSIPTRAERVLYLAALTRAWHPTGIPPNDKLRLPDVHSPYPTPRPPPVNGWSEPPYERFFDDSRIDWVASSSFVTTLALASSPNTVRLFRYALDTCSVRASVSQGRREALVPLQSS